MNEDSIQTINRQLEEILARLVLLDAKVASLRRVHRRYENEEHVAALVALIWKATRGEEFLVAQIFDRTYVAREQMHVALVAALSEPTPKKLGQLLRRHEGEIISGHRVMRVGKSSEGIFWQLT